MPVILPSEAFLNKTRMMLKDEGFAVIAAMMNKMDVFIDDPRKAAVFEARSVHVVRPSELIWQRQQQNVSKGGVKSE